MYVVEEIYALLSIDLAGRNMYIVEELCHFTGSHNSNLLYFLELDFFPPSPLVCMDVKLVNYVHFLKYMIRNVETCSRFHPIRSILLQIADVNVCHDNCDYKFAS